MADKKTVFPEDLKNQFKNLVNARCGFYFKDYDLKDLERAIAGRMRALRADSPFVYYNILSFSDKKEDEFRELLNLLTVKHTYFFRNEPQFKVLKEKILPEIVARKAGGSYSVPRTAYSVKENSDAARSTQYAAQKPSLRIWSAGCSTGEEPYSIAMTVKDAIPDLENWDVQILATDASTEALEAAKRGVYSVNSMRLVDPGHLMAHFAEIPKAGPDARYALRDEIKKMVNFAYFNLMDEDYPRGFDIIFCRNVTIYFELETTINVTRKFEQSLDDDGYLFIGYSETLQFIADKFRMMNLEDAIFYVKSKEPAAGLAEFAPLAVPPAARKIDEVLEELSKAEFRAEEEAIEKKAHPARFDELLIRAIKSIHAKNYEEAVSLIGEARDIDKDAVEPYYLAAEAYTNQGRFREARENLDTALDKDAMFAPAHYLLGAIHSEEARTEEAEKSYRRSIYLDKEFSLAHFSLGNIYKESGRINAALREYRNTLNILSKSKPYDILPYSGGFNAATLSSVCKNNIERLKGI